MIDSVQEDESETEEVKVVLVEPAPALGLV
jgi:hypothetical protein